MPSLSFLVKCEKCKSEVVVTDVEQDGTIWIDPYSCDCDHGSVVDCGFDDRTGNHSLILLERDNVADYCNELQKQIAVFEKATTLSQEAER